MTMTPSQLYDLFVVGTASLDVLHLGQETVQAAGGAGIYTALAAHRAGAKVGLFGPRPDPMPASLQPIAERLTWLGPTIAPDSVAHLEIAHYGGGKAELLHADWGAELDFKPDKIPATVSESNIIHIAALSSAERQLNFLVALLDRDIMEDTAFSAGTYGRLVYEQTERVQQLFDLTDLFFMNENEAKGLFGQVDQARTRPDGLLFVTLGAEGALVIEGETVTHIPAVATVERDPTGAGDTFCGTTLAGLSQGLSPVEAAQQGVVWATRTVSQIGPAALIDD